MLGVDLTYQGEVLRALGSGFVVQVRTHHLEDCHVAAMKAGHLAKLYLNIRETLRNTTGNSKPPTPPTPNATRGVPPGRGRDPWAATPRQARH